MPGDLKQLIIITEIDQLLLLHMRIVDARSKPATV